MFAGLNALSVAGSARGPVKGNEAAVIHAVRLSIVNRSREVSARAASGQPKGPGAAIATVCRCIERPARTIICVSVPAYSVDAVREASSGFGP
jgi:hypothetical protein